MKNRYTSLLLFLFLVPLLLAACSSTAPAPASEVGEGAGTITEATAVAGKSTVTGRLLSSRDGTPLAETPVRLAEVFRQGDAGAYVLDGANSPGAITDAQGAFVIANIDIKEYVMVAGDPYAEHEIITDPATGKAKIWQTTADEVLAVGDIKVNIAP